MEHIDNNPLDILEWRENNLRLAIDLLKWELEWVLLAKENVLKSNPVGFKRKEEDFNTYWLII